MAVDDADRLAPQDHRADATGPACERASHDGLRLDPSQVITGIGTAAGQAAELVPVTESGLPRLLTQLTARQ